MFRNDCNDTAGNSDVIKTFGSSELTQSVYNLRMWIACTVLHRLEAEIVKTNKAFECRGFVDLKIGSVGLDRLKKTAENQQLVCMSPILPMIVPFLEMSSNQEYLVRRINDLAKGCVLSEYRWNGGGNYNSLNWDEHLPTDSAVCAQKMHCTTNGRTIQFLSDFSDHFPFVLHVFGQSIAAVATTWWPSVFQSICRVGRQKVTEGNYCRSEK